MRRFSLSPRSFFLRLGASTSMLAVACSGAGPTPPGERAVGRAASALASCAPSIDPLRSIEIVHPNIVNDARASNALDGPWSFRRLIETIARSPAQADTDALLRSMFESWLRDQVVNGDVLPARPGVQFAVLDSFSIPGSSPRSFDLSRAPFTLIAIASRVDLRDGGTRAGEGRFVFGLTSPFGGFQSMTLNIEFSLPLVAPLDTADKWAARWHALDAIDPTTDPGRFTATLQGITDAFTSRGVAPWKPNGSAVNQIRTNEIAFGSPWQLREFNLGWDGLMAPATTKNSVNQSTIPNSRALLDFLDATPAFASTSDTQFFSVTMPSSFEGIPFLGGKADEGTTFLTLPDGENQASSVRVDNFSLMTCNGCHNDSKPPGDIAFYNVSPIASPFNPVTGANDGTGRLSRFMTQGDPAKGGRRPSELSRRSADMANLLCIGGGRAFDLAPGSARFEVGLASGQAYVEVFLRKNGVQFVAAPITASETPVGSGLSTYPFDSGDCSAGDVIEFRFYSYLAGHPGVFTPGPGESDWLTHVCGADQAGD